MTYSELLHSVSFCEIAPHLSQYFPKMGQNPDTAWLLTFRLHYDALRLMTPVENDHLPEEDKTIAVSYYDAEEGERSGLYAFYLEGMNWEESLAKALVIEDGVKATTAEIAACCLWHSSFYCSLPEERERAIKELTEDVEQELFHRYRKKYGRLLSSAARQMAIKPRLHYYVRQRMRGIPTRVDYTDDIFDKPRKRRYWKRVSVNAEYRELVTTICQFAERVTNGDISAALKAEDLLSLLFGATRMQTGYIPSFAGAPDKREEYVKDVFAEYISASTQHLSQAIICVSTSSDFPLAHEELTALKEVLSSGKLSVLYLQKTDDSLGKELRIDYAYYR